jgi:hypothetical protein
MTDLHKKQTPDEYRALLYFRQSVIARWLPENNSVWPCLRWGVPDTKSIDVIKRGERAGYAHLQHCKRGWLCPICSNQLARTKRAGMERAIFTMQRSGYALVFVTYTIQHKANDSLVVVRDRVQRAHVELHSGKAWRAIERDFDWAGSIKAVEATYNENGWHWHLHEIGFVGDDSDLERLRVKLDSRWDKATLHVGAYAKARVGLVIKLADRGVRDYVAKWGIAPELAPGTSKGARHGGVLPFQFPDLWLNRLWDEARARDRFSEYAEGTKGVKQLWASPSVRTFMAKIKDDKPEGVLPLEPFAQITLDQWRAIWKSGQRSTCLKAAEDGDLTNFLDRLKIDA